MTYCLDTNAYADWFKGLYWEDEIANASTLYIPAIVLGELFYGFACGDKEQLNIQKLERTLAHPSVKVCPVTKETGHHYGILKKYLRKNGTPLPENDIWIAATALEHQTTLLTRDKHFKKLPQVSVMFAG